MSLLDCFPATTGKQKLQEEFLCTPQSHRTGKVHFNAKICSAIITMRQDQIPWSRMLHPPLPAATDCKFYLYITSPFQPHWPHQWQQRKSVILTLAKASMLTHRQGSRLMWFTESHPWIGRIILILSLLPAVKNPHALVKYSLWNSD